MSWPVSASVTEEARLDAKEWVCVNGDKATSLAREGDSRSPSELAAVCVPDVASTIVVVGISVGSREEEVADCAWERILEISSETPAGRLNDAVGTSKLPLGTGTAPFEIASETELIGLEAMEATDGTGNGDVAIPAALVRMPDAAVVTSGICVETESSVLTMLDGKVSSSAVAVETG